MYDGSKTEEKGDICRDSFESFFIHLQKALKLTYGFVRVLNKQLYNPSSKMDFLFLF